MSNAISPNYIRMKPQPDIKLDDMPVCINKWSDEATKNMRHSLKLRGWYQVGDTEQPPIAIFECSCGRLNYV